jgi:hypothetical protein
MRTLEIVNLEVLRRHEQQTASNAVLGGYGMDSHCPLHEFELSRVQLESCDTERIFLLSEFRPHTAHQSGKLTDVTAAARMLERVGEFINAAIDLRSSQNLDLVLVSAAADRAPLIVIDGNHAAANR